MKTRTLLSLALAGLLLAPFAANAAETATAPASETPAATAETQPGTTATGGTAQEQHKMKKHVKHAVHGKKHEKKHDVKSEGQGSEAPAMEGTSK